MQERLGTISIDENYSSLAALHEGRTYPQRRKPAFPVQRLFSPFGEELSTINGG